MEGDEEGVSMNRRALVSSIGSAAALSLFPAIAEAAKKKLEDAGGKAEIK